MQTIAVSILNYNNLKDTLSCLDSLMNLSKGNYRLLTFVLDNGSKESLEVNTNKYNKINLKILQSEENTGFTGGHNIVYKHASKIGFDYFLLLNNDCIVERDCFKNLADRIKGDVGAAVPKIYFTKGFEYHKDRYTTNQRGRVIWYAGGKFDWNLVTSKHQGLDEVDNGQFDVESDIEFATGACVVLSKILLSKVGLFDEKFFLYFEDADLSLRIKKAGYRIVYVPNAVVWHNNAGSSGSGSSLHDYYLTRNKLLFGVRYAPLKMKVHVLKEALVLLVKGRHWQKIGVRDYLIRRFGKGSFNG